MLSTKLVKISSMLLLVSGLCSCAKPPDIPGCTGFPSPTWFVVKTQFLKMCSDDPVCKADLPKYSLFFERATVPSEEGICRRVISGKLEQVKPGGKLYDMEWKDLVEKSIILPAKQSWAPLKTFIQDQCHQNKNCGEVGNWERTVQAFDEQVK